MLPSHLGLYEQYGRAWMVRVMLEPVKQVVQHCLGLNVAMTTPPTAQTRPLRLRDQAGHAPSGTG